MNNPAAKVLFNSIVEFKTDVCRGRITSEREGVIRSNLAEEVLRATKLYKDDPATSGTIKHVFVVAGVLRLTKGVLQLIELSVYCGQYWPGSGDDPSVQSMQNADKLLDEIAGFASEHQLALGAGQYQLPK
jgi:hypothetical protein